MRIMIWILTGLMLYLSGCSHDFTALGRKFIDRGEYQAAEDYLREYLGQHPDSPGAWRELGVACYHQREFEEALTALDRAEQSDYRVHFYRGLIHEEQGDLERAREDQVRALELKPGGGVKDAIRQHLTHLTQKNIEAQVKQALAAEQQLQPATVPENTVAVFDLEARDLDEEFAPLARGLAVLTLVDLAKVSSLRPLERLKIETVLREMELARAGYLYPGTAPRAGRIVGSRHIVTGNLSMIGDQLQINGAVTTLDSATAYLEPCAERSGRILRAQKDFVFKVIDELGVTLNSEERHAIEEVPTESDLALLAYCRGLEYRLVGDFERAHEEFRQALKYDSDFGMAQDELNTTGDLLEPDVPLSALEQAVLDPSAGRDSQLHDVQISSGVIDDDGSGGDQGENRPAPPAVTGSVRIQGSVGQ